MNNKSQKFKDFLNTLKDENPSLIEAVIAGFDEISNHSLLEATKKDPKKVFIKTPKGKLKDLLKIPEGKKVSDVYKSGKKLVKDLLDANKGDKKKTLAQLSFAARINKDDNIYDIAFKHMKTLTEAESNPKSRFSYGNTPKDVFLSKFDEHLGENGAYSIIPRGLMAEIMDRPDVLEGVHMRDGSRNGEVLFDKENLWILLDNLFNLSSALDEKDLSIDNNQNEVFSIRTDILQTLGIEEI